MATAAAPGVVLSACCVVASRACGGAAVAVFTLPLCGVDPLKWGPVLFEPFYNDLVVSSRVMFPTHVNVQWINIY